MNDEIIEYASLLDDLKVRIRQAQTRAALSANREMLALYWDVGSLIHDRQEREGWGSAVIPRLSRDLRNELPEMKGFSERNLKRMIRFYREYPELIPIVPQAVAPMEPGPRDASAPLAEIVLALPWGHNFILIEKVKDLRARRWYMQQALKDPYIFDFMILDSPFRERELEAGLVDHLERFMLELGVGFAFVGRQYCLAVGRDDFYLDLLFYHLKLRCFVVIDLKIGAFKPDFAGKMNFYLNVVDDVLRHEHDNPSIGLILCRDNKKILAEYALRGVDKPIGVSEYELTRALPDTLKSSLPTIEEIETELSQPERDEDEE